MFVDTHDYFQDRAYFKYVWIWLPRRCYNTSRRIWGKVLLGTAIWTGPGDPAIEQRWYHKDEGLIMLLKGNISHGTI